jgi:hypothetical protein
MDIDDGEDDDPHDGQGRTPKQLDSHAKTGAISLIALGFCLLGILAWPIVKPAVDAFVAWIILHAH